MYFHGHLPHLGRSNNPSLNTDMKEFESPVIPVLNRRNTNHSKSKPLFPYCLMKTKKKKLAVIEREELVQTNPMAD